MKKLLGFFLILLCSPAFAQTVDVPEKTYVVPVSEQTISVPVLIGGQTKVFSVKVAAQTVNFKAPAYQLEIQASTQSQNTLFSPTSFWNRKLTTEAIAPDSIGLVAELAANNRLAGPWINTSQYSTPIYFVDSLTPKVPVSIVQGGKVLSWTALNAETQKGVPLPANVAAAAGTDGTLTIYDKSADKLYEFWRFRNVSGKWQAEWGGILPGASVSEGIMPTVQNAAGGKEYWGATATSLPAAGGTILLSELKAGVIHHALAFAIVRPKQGSFKWPAQRTDGWYNGPNAIQEGQRFRFPADVAINPAWSPLTKMLVAAVRDYGMVLRDRSGATVFFVEDPAQYGLSGDQALAPYLGGKQIWDVVGSVNSDGEFPWSKLQALL